MLDFLRARYKNHVCMVRMQQKYQPQDSPSPQLVGTECHGMTQQVYAESEPVMRLLQMTHLIPVTYFMLLTFYLLLLHREMFCVTLTESPIKMDFGA